jgi:hypothetical protein
MTLFHNFQVSLPKYGGSLKGGRGGEGGWRHGGQVHHERGELLLGEETQKLWEETPSPKFKPLSNAPRCHPRSGMALPCGPY